MSRKCQKASSARLLGRALGRVLGRGLAAGNIVNTSQHLRPAAGLLAAGDSRESGEQTAQ